MWSMNSRGGSGDSEIAAPFSHGRTGFGTGPPHVLPGEHAGRDDRDQPGQAPNRKTRPTHRSPDHRPRGQDPFLADESRGILARLRRDGLSDIGLIGRGGCRRARRAVPHDQRVPCRAPSPAA